MTDSNPQRRWFWPTPGWLILVLLVVEGLLWLSERLQWPIWHKGYAVLIAVASVGVAMLVMLVWFAVALVFRWHKLNRKMETGHLSPIEKTGHALAANPGQMEPNCRRIQNSFSIPNSETFFPQFR